MWKRWVRGSLLALSAVLASFLVYLLTTRTDSQVPPSAASTGLLENRADAGIEQFTYVSSRGGAVQWEVLAKRARMFEAEKRALLDDVQVTLFGEHGWELKVFGDEGAIDTAKKDFVLTERNGDVIVELQNGYTIYTNHLAWVDARREISTQDPVRIAGQGMVVTGIGLIGHPDQEEFQILDDVHVQIVQ
jgi:lipopolysaccharide export system protein LptC